MAHGFTIEQMFELVREGLAKEAERESVYMYVCVIAKARAEGRDDDYWQSEHAKLQPATDERVLARSDWLGTIR